MEVVPPLSDVFNKPEGMSLKANYQKTFRLSFNEYAVPVKKLQRGVQIQLHRRVFVQWRIDAEGPVGGRDEILPFVDPGLQATSDRPEHLKTEFGLAGGGCLSKNGDELSLSFHEARNQKSTGSCRNDSWKP